LISIVYFVDKKPIELFTSFIYPLKPNLQI